MPVPCRDKKQLMLVGTKVVVALLVLIETALMDDIHVNFEKVLSTDVSFSNTNISAPLECGFKSRSLNQYLNFMKENIIT